MRGFAEATLSNSRFVHNSKNIRGITDKTTWMSCNRPFRDPTEPAVRTIFFFIMLGLQWSEIGISILAWTKHCFVSTELNCSLSPQTLVMTFTDLMSLWFQTQWAISVCFVFWFNLQWREGPRCLRRLPARHKRRERRTVGTRISASSSWMAW